MSLSSTTMTSTTITSFSSAPLSLRNSAHHPLPITHRPSSLAHRPPPIVFCRIVLRPSPKILRQPTTAHRPSSLTHRHIVLLLFPSSLASRPSSLTAHLPSCRLPSRARSLRRRSRTRRPPLFLLRPSPTAHRPPRRPSSFVHPSSPTAHPPDCPRGQDIYAVGRVPFVSSFASVIKLPPCIVIWLWLSDILVAITPSHASDSRRDENNAQKRAVSKTSHP